MTLSHSVNARHEVIVHVKGSDAIAVKKQLDAAAAAKLGKHSASPDKIHMHFSVSRPENGGKNLFLVTAMTIYPTPAHAKKAYDINNVNRRFSLVISEALKNLDGFVWLRGEAI